MKIPSHKMSVSSDQKEWNDLCSGVNKQMGEHVKRHVTPISKVLSNEFGEQLGSGSYVQIHGDTYLVTNEHVGRIMKTNSVTHQFADVQDVFRCTNPMVAEGYPIDCAVSRIDTDIWNRRKHHSIPITESQFSECHKTVPHELLFLIGYSGDRSRFLFETLVTPGTPYLTQESELPNEGCDESLHFALHYKPDLALPIEVTSVGLPNPPGLSGSLVWNTRRVEFLNTGKEWSPEAARITGIVWGWNTTVGCLIATKVEQLTNSLSNLVSRYPTPNSRSN